MAGDTEIGLICVYPCLFSGKGKDGDDEDGPDDSGQQYLRLTVKGPFLYHPHSLTSALASALLLYLIARVVPFPIPLVYKEIMGRICYIFVYCDTILLGEPGGLKGGEAFDTPLRISGESNSQDRKSPKT